MYCQHPFSAVAVFSKRRPDYTQNIRDCEEQQHLLSYLQTAKNDTNSFACNNHVYYRATNHPFDQSNSPSLSQAFTQKLLPIYDAVYRNRMKYCGTNQHPYMDNQHPYMEKHSKVFSIQTVMVTEFCACSFFLSLLKITAEGCCKNVYEREFTQETNEEMCYALVDASR